MRRLALIGLLSITYVACLDGARVGSPRPAEFPTRLRVAIATPAPEPLRACTGAALTGVERSGAVRPGLARSWQADEHGLTWTFRLDGAASSEAIARWWDRALGDPESPARWLLAPLAGQNGIRAPAPDRLVLRLTRSVPDLAERLSHPSLEVPVGPYRSADDRLLERNPDSSAGRETSIDEVLVYRADASLLLRVGEVDAAVLYGADAESFIADPPAGTVAERAPGWDRTFALWLNSGSSELADQGVRDGILRALDRQATTRRLFGNRAVPVTSLLGIGAAPAAMAPGAVSRRAAAMPRISLMYRGDDPQGAAIASRVRAELLAAGCVVDPEPTDPDSYERRLREGSFVMALFEHHLTTPDPLLRLGLTLWGLRSVARDGLAGVERAAAEAGPALRELEAARIESILIVERRLVPLLVLEAWLVRDERLSGLLAPRWARLTLEQTRWKR